MSELTIIVNSLYLAPHMLRIESRKMLPNTNAIKKVTKYERH